MAEEPICVTVNLWTKEFWSTFEDRPDWYFNPGPLLVSIVYVSAVLLVVISAVLECFREKTYWQDDEFIEKCRSIPVFQKLPKSVQDVLLLDEHTNEWVHKGNRLQQAWSFVQFKCVVVTVRSYVALDLGVATEDVDMICELCSRRATTAYNPEFLMAKRDSSANEEERQKLESDRFLQSGIVSATIRVQEDRFCTRACRIYRSWQTCKMSVVRGVTIRALLVALELSSIIFICAFFATLAGELFSWLSDDECDFSLTNDMVLRTLFRGFWAPIPAMAPKVVFIKLYKGHYMVDSFWDFRKLVLKRRLQDIVLWLLAFATVGSFLWVTITTTANVHENAQQRWAIVVISAVGWRYGVHPLAYAVLMSVVVSHCFWASPRRAKGAHQSFRSAFSATWSIDSTWSETMQDLSERGPTLEVMEKENTEGTLASSPASPVLTEQEQQVQNSIREADDHIKVLQENHSNFLAIVSRMHKDPDADWKAHGRGPSEFHDKDYDEAMQESLYLGVAAANAQQLRDAKDENAVRAALHHAAHPEGLQSHLPQAYALSVVSERGETPYRLGLGRESTSFGMSSDAGSVALALRGERAASVESLQLAPATRRGTGSASWGRPGSAPSTPSGMGSAVLEASLSASSRVRFADTAQHEPVVEPSIAPGNEAQGEQTVEAASAQLQPVAELDLAPGNEARGEVLAEANDLSGVMSAGVGSNCNEQIA